MDAMVSAREGRWHTAQPLLMLVTELSLARGHAHPPSCHGQQQSGVDQAGALWPAPPGPLQGECPPCLQRVEPRRSGDLSQVPTGLTQVNIREALCGDGVSRVFVDVLQAQAGKLWFVKQPGLRGTAHQQPAPTQDPRQISWFKTCHKFQVLGPGCSHNVNPRGREMFSKFTDLRNQCLGGGSSEGRTLLGR